MKKSDWKGIAELIGIAAIVASLVFVGFQLRQELEIARSEVWSERTLIRAELASLINDNGETWVKGLQDGDLSESERAKFAAIASLFISKQMTHFFQRATDISPGMPEHIALQLVDMLNAYPGLKSIWSEHVSYHRARDSMNPFHREVERLSSMVNSGEIETVPFDGFYPPQ